jgi:hypothetical protein
MSSPESIKLHARLSGGSQRRWTKIKRSKVIHDRFYRTCNNKITIIFQGNTYDVRYPYVVIGIVSVTGMLAALLLPETLHQRLPETLADAHIFGLEQKFWSLPKKPVTVNIEMAEIPLKS